MTATSDPPQGLVRQPFEPGCFAPPLDSRGRALVEPTPVLRGGPSTRAIGLLVDYDDDPFFAGLSRSIEEVCHRRRYGLVLCSSNNDPDRQSHYVRLLLEKRVAGLILTGVGDPAAVAAELADCPVPLLVLDREVPALEADGVCLDHEGAGRLATRHLLGLGHRAIGCVLGPRSNRVFEPRLQGYQRALAEAGVSPRAGWVVESQDLTLEGGFVAARRLLCGRAGCPTAIFASTDLLGVGVLRQASALGIDVPRSLSVVGLDGVDLGRYLRPALTSVAQPIGRMGRAAAGLLLERVERGGPLGCRRLKFAPELVLGESTGPAP